MSSKWRDRWNVPVTAVANTFIDEYMAGANGEYVKVYLYLLRHADQELTIEKIADALNHTESDVSRAISYWKKVGVLEEEEQEPDAAEAALAEEAGEPEPAAKPENRTPVYSAEQVNRLCKDEEFSQLLYISQKYLNRVFTPRDCQVFAYLYEGLGMNIELLEYLVEYCAQNGHTSVRYLEAVALNWHGKGIKTAQDAKDHCASHTKDAFAVMKAFGLNSRKPAAPEQELMDKWFKDFGFSRDLVLEACARTITATHVPSFQYADKILTDWKKAGIRSLEELKAQDARRKAARSKEMEADREKRVQKYSAGVREQTARKSSNQFHNFNQRDTDYDALALKKLKKMVDTDS